MNKSLTSLTVLVLLTGGMLLGGCASAEREHDSGVHVRWGSRSDASPSTHVLVDDSRQMQLSEMTIQ